MPQSRTRSGSPPGASLAAALTRVTEAVQHAVDHRVTAGRGPDPAGLREETWQLIHLLGALGDLAAALAPQVGGYPERYRLHADDDVDPAEHVARTCRELAALRHALGEAEGAAREVYTAVSHLHAVPEDTTGTASRADHP
ncbi:hypothetical protein SacmaDRAFT_0128 [Saccharomonospora marina XMU15]|uniref:Uncharacterized protein n=1 Tax=Saccharomonospora marina XMU15 TaxID=882083 RepID=H5WYB0_9PSEU|nr:hypothetical protein [Saccharomonospora marina]EHR48444.1 hypothetical protein SacmaDRAFT_0128 [Saccharomonospora marina XMU15]